MPQKVLFVSTYPPRQCGIASFTSDLVATMKELKLPFQPFIMSISDSGDEYDYPDDVVYTIVNSRLSFLGGNYKKAARFVNEGDFDLVCINHEYGIFSGKWGRHILNFVHQITKPFVVVLHTVSPHPSATCRDITQKLISEADAVIVLARIAFGILRDHYALDGNLKKITYIPIGVPDFPLFPQNTAKKMLNLEGKFIISTFGLMNNGKGIDYVIKAMPHIIKKHPQVTQLIIGKTHPTIFKNEGDSYLRALKKLAHELNVDNNIQFVTRFLGETELLTYLKATDIFITPYLNYKQVASSALAHALACGKPVISTPYLFAKEILAGGMGVLVGFQDVDAIVDAVTLLIESPKLRKNISEKAYQYSRKMTWQNVVPLYAEVFQKTLVS